MRVARAKLSRHADVAKAMDYMLKRWNSFSRFLNDSGICLSADGVEKPQTSCGCSFLRLFPPRLHHPLVGALGTFDVVHFLVPNFLDPVVSIWSCFAVLPWRAGLQRQLAELHRGKCRTSEGVLRISGQDVLDHYRQLPGCRDGSRSSKRALRCFGRPSCFHKHLASVAVPLIGDTAMPRRLIPGLPHLWPQSKVAA
jgi:hypothetical protein